MKWGRRRGGASHLSPLGRCGSRPQNAGRRRRIRHRIATQPVGKGTRAASIGLSRGCGVEPVLSGGLGGDFLPLISQRLFVEALLVAALAGSDYMPGERLRWTRRLGCHSYAPLRGHHRNEVASVRSLTKPAKSLKPLHPRLGRIPPSGRLTTAAIAGGRSLESPFLEGILGSRTISPEEHECRWS